MNRNEYEICAQGSGMKRRDLIVLGLATAAGVAVTSLRNETTSLPSDPPPIIIKSGSFNIEVDTSLNETSINPFVYRRFGFGDVKGVRVFRTNEINGAADSDSFQDRNGIDIDIRLQKFTGGAWRDDGPPVTVRAEAGTGGAKDLVLSIGKKLAQKGHPKPGRLQRWRDDDTENIRFGQIAVRKNNGSRTTYNAVNGDDFVIAIYNRLG